MNSLDNKITKYKKNNKDIFSQYKKTYQSTIDFEKFIRKQNEFKKTKKIIDIGCAIGAQVYYFYKKNPSIKFTGSDYNKYAIEWAKKINKNNTIKFIKNNFVKDNKKLKNKFDGIISIQTFCEIVGYEYK